LLVRGLARAAGRAMALLVRGQAVGQIILGPPGFVAESICRKLLNVSPFDAVDICSKEPACKVLLVVYAPGSLPAVLQSPQ
jgi:hypothetical protein